MSCRNLIHRKAILLTEKAKKVTNMKNNTFTAEESVMIDLGLNPGLVENYSEVSWSPSASKRKRASLGALAGSPSTRRTVTTIID